MKKQRNILRFAGLLMLFSVLFTHVFSHSFSELTSLEQWRQNEEKVQQQEGKSTCKQAAAPGKDADNSKESQEQEGQTTISQLTFEVVVPSYAFDFGVPLISLFSPKFEFLSVEETLPEINNPAIIDSYFEKLFEHHIAINAP